MRLKDFFAFRYTGSEDLVRVVVFDTEGPLDQKGLEIFMTPLQAMKAAEDLITASRDVLRRQAAARDQAEREARREANLARRAEAEKI